MARSPRAHALANRLASPLRDGYAPAQAAAEHHGQRLEAAWGERPGAALSADAPDTPPWAAGLTIPQRLYVAELTALLRVLLTTPGVSPRSWLTETSDVSRHLVGWLVDAPASTATGLTEAAAAWGRERDPFADRAQDVLVALLPASHRHAIGLYPTPPWMARRVVAHLGGAGRPPVMDPACGTGVFLLEMLRALAEGSPDSRHAVDLAEAVVGVETSPLLVGATRLALGRAARALAGDDLPRAWTPTVHCADLLCDLRAAPGHGSTLLTAEGPVALEATPLVLGNPPWVAWDALPTGYKTKLAAGPLAALDAFDRSGFEAQLGAANDDVSALFAQVALAHLVAPSGQLVFLLKWNLITNETARVLRRFEVRWRDGAPFTEPVPYAAERLCDLRRCNPFEAAVEPALWCLRRDAAMGPRLPAERWNHGRGHRVEVTPEDDYTPVQAGHPEGPWAPSTAARSATQGLEGDFGWDIRHGLKHDCNAVFLLELLDAPGDGADLLQARNRPETSRRIRAPRWRGPLEARYIRPLIQSRYLRAFTLTGWSHVLAPVAGATTVPEEELRRSAPHTWRYLDGCRDPLAARRSRVFANPPFYRMFGVGPYNDAPALVVWSGMGFRPWFLVVDEVQDPILGRVRPLPDGSCYLIPTPSLDEAHYLAGLLNSPPVHAFLESRSSGSKRGLSRAVVSRLALPPFDASDPTHRALAEAAASLARAGSEAAVPSSEERAAVDALATAVLVI